MPERTEMSDVSGFDRICLICRAWVRQIGHKGHTMGHYDIVHDSVITPRVGASLLINDIWYEVMRTVTEQDDESQFVTMVTLRPVDDDGYTLEDMESITVNLDMMDYSY